ncbi:MULTISPECIES: virulence RhuM family protein [Synergistaceae]|uniref:virulence RhuM family protein n=1 Tax=Synergistaceae TaxID=649777 RepID=UPI003ADFD721|nr:virulence RhuM family protein [Synergistaceae bacterium DZ-S4]
MNRDFQFLVYRSANQDVSVSAIIKDETVWLTQKGMAELFGVNIPAISKHLQNIYEEGELNRDATVSKMEIVQTEGARTVKRNVDLYNLDSIISVGYRVSSARATHFRIWATGVLKEYMTKAEKEYEVFNKTQKIISDFDKEVKRLLEKRYETDE